MWSKIKNIIFTHLVQSIVLAFVVIASITGVSYFVIQKVNSSDNAKDSTSGSDIKSCIESVKIGTVTIEKDPAGDPEAWLRFNYITTANQALNCQYTVTFYNSQQEVVRTISNVEDTFQSPMGQIYNGYSGTPYQEGMTAKVSIL